LRIFMLKQLDSPCRKAHPRGCLSAL